MWRVALLGAAVLAAHDARAVRSSSLSNTIIALQHSLTLHSSAPLVSPTSSSNTASAQQLCAPQSSSLSSPATLARRSNLNTSRPSPTLPCITDNAVTTGSPGRCTGCVIQAFNPLTTYYNAFDNHDAWSKLVVTETIVTEFITYYQDRKIETVVTTSKTFHRTQAVIGKKNETITHTTPQTTITPTLGVLLTLPAGPIYVVYTNVYGGQDHYYHNVYSDLDPAPKTCNDYPSAITAWQPLETNDWRHFIETYNSMPKPRTVDGPVPLPTNLLSFLKQDTDIASQFSGRNIATCSTLTLKPRPQPSWFPTAPFQTIPIDTDILPLLPDPPQLLTNPPAIPSRTTATFLSTTFASASSHITRHACLRCQNTASGGDAAETSNSNGPTGPINPITRIGSGQSVIANDAIPIETGTPVVNPGQSNQVLPVIIVGSDTITAGQTKTIDGVPVIVPVPDGSPRIIMGNNTVPILPSDPIVAFLTVESAPITASSQGQFLVGTQALLPGDPLITHDGDIRSLSPSDYYVVMNGVTSKLTIVPLITPPPTLTIDGQTYLATVQGGKAQYVLGPGVTLDDGNTVTMGGTTYGLDPRGTALVINGQTSSIPAAPACDSADSMSGVSRGFGTESRSGAGAASATNRSSVRSGSLSKASAAAYVHGAGLLHGWVEWCVVGAAGWMALLL